MYRLRLTWSLEELLLLTDHHEIEPVAAPLVREMTPWMLDILEQLQMTVEWANGNTVYFPMNNRVAAGLLARRLITGNDTFANTTDLGYALVQLWRVMKEERM